MGQNRRHNRAHAQVSTSSDNPQNSGKRNQAKAPKIPAEVTTMRPATTSVPSAPLTERPPEDTPRFSDLNANGPIVDPVLVETITNDLHFDRMMPVQAATIHELLPPKRDDCLVQAKTGTGKTLAFLLPAIQTLLSGGRATSGRISLLALAPTRELAMQIAKEATNLLQRLPKLRVCLAIGGTNKNSEEKAILAGCNILIGTPGRLLDHISNTPAIQKLLGQLDTVVLDEADRLLDMGFLPALQSIIGCLPPKAAAHWQGMLFSATVPAHVAKVAKLVLAPGYRSISTIPVGTTGLHERVPQFLIEVPTFSDIAPALVGALRRAIHEQKPAGSFKAIVFAQTAAMADFYAHLISRLPDMPPSWVLHSRHAQTKRTKTTAAFRAAPAGILVATDVVARGMDFPAVTTVFQVGLPMDRESYIHRLGRTARGAAGQADEIQGRGVFLVAAAEAFFPTRVLRDVDFAREAADVSSRDELSTIIEATDDVMVGKVYQAWLGYYKSYLKAMNWDKDQLVREANAFAKTGLLAASTPALSKSVVGKMGLRGMPGLLIVPDAPRMPNGGGKPKGRGRDETNGGKDTDRGGAGAGGAGGGRGGRGGNRGRGRQGGRRSEHQQ